MDSIIPPEPVKKPKDPSKPIPDDEILRMKSRLRNWKIEATAALKKEKEALFEKSTWASTFYERNKKERGILTEEEVKEIDEISDLEFKLKLGAPTTTLLTVTLLHKFVLKPLKLPPIARYASYAFNAGVVYFSYHFSFRYYEYLYLNTMNRIVDDHGFGVDDYLDVNLKNLLERMKADTEGLLDEDKLPILKEVEYVESKLVPYLEELKQLGVKED